MICSVCKEPIAPGARYCENCGARVVPDPAVPASDMAAPQSPADTVAPADLAPLTTAQCVGILLAFCVPVLNWILMLTWAYAPRGNESRRSMARAGLVLTGVVIGLTVVGLACALAAVSLGLVQTGGVV